MNKLPFILLVLLLGCGGPAHINDTEFLLSVKMVDGSWSEAAWDLPSTSKFTIQGNNGTYYLHCYRWDGDHGGVRLKTAVIDYKVLKKTLVLDTTSTRIDLER